MNPFRSLILGLLLLISATGARAVAPPLRDQVSLNGAWTQGGQVPQYFGFPLAGGESRTFARRVDVPAAWAGKVIRLELGGVAHKAEIYINGKLIATHLGAFSPFGVDLTDRVQAGRSFELKIVVSGSDALKTGTKYCEWPVGGWIKTGGIQDDVWLRAYGRVAIEEAYLETHVTPRPSFLFDYKVRNHDVVARSFQVHGMIRRESTGRVEQEFFSPPKMLEPGAMANAGVHRGAPLSLYWPDDPVLYLMEIEVIVGDRVVDREVRRFGFREIKVQGRQILWNGVPINLYGDYQVFGDSWYVDSKTIHARAAWPKTVDRMKSLNIRCMRWHHNPVPQYILDVADEKGLLICDESANYARDWMKGMPAEVKERYIRNFLATAPSWVKADRWHPSVYLWNATNEMTYDFAAQFTASECQRFGGIIHAADRSRPVGYDGDRSASHSLWNAHYPEGYNEEPKGSIYSWTGAKAGRYELPADKPWGTGEALHTRSPLKDAQARVERNTWWLGIWTRGLRLAGWTDVRPACYWFTIKDMQSADPAVRRRSENLKNAFAPVALFDKAYDDLGIAPYVTGTKPGGKLPEAAAGAALERTLILYNDDFKGDRLTAEVEVRAGGRSYGKRTREVVAAPGSHIELPWRVDVPNRPGMKMEMILRVRKDGKLRFEEPRSFKITE